MWHANMNIGCAICLLIFLNHDLNALDLRPKSRAAVISSAALLQTCNLKIPSGKTWHRLWTTATTPRESNGWHQYPSKTSVTYDPRSTKMLSAVSFACMGPGTRTCNPLHPCCNIGGPPSTGVANSSRAWYKSISQTNPWKLFLSGWWLTVLDPVISTKKTVTSFLDGIRAQRRAPIVVQGKHLKKLLALALRIQQTSIPWSSVSSSQSLRYWSRL